jgi:AbrB family looped-hinge helix DNA binding protein
MAETTLSPKYQVVIPAEVRRGMDLRPGQKMTVLARGRIIMLVPVRPLRELRGMARGIPLEGFREEIDRL